jgi:two-component system, LytTR family, response regulator
MIRSIAVDDEPLALEVIKKYASETPLINLAATFTDAIQAMAYLKTQPVGLIFLDIQMPDISGIQLLKSLREKPLVVFTTAFAEYAVQGFDLEAIDFLVKPIKFDRFMKAVMKAVKTLAANAPALGPDEGFFFVKAEYQMVKIFYHDINYIEGLDDYVKINLFSDPRPVLSLMSLKSLLQKLPADHFMRVHRSFIVPLKNITSIRNRSIYLDRTVIPIGDTFLAAVQEWLTLH